MGEFYDVFRSKPTDLLVLGSDEYKRSVILNLSDEDEVRSFFGGTFLCVCVCVCRGYNYSKLCFFGIGYSCNKCN